MQQRHYKSILYFISSVILITLFIQVYWNYKNYEAGKAQLLRDVQTSLDTTIENYYENIVRRNTHQYINLNNDTTTIINNSTVKINNITIENDPQNEDAYTTSENGKFINDFIKKFPDAMVDTTSNRSERKTLIIREPKKLSPHNEALKNLTSKVVISLDNARFDWQVVDSLFTTISTFTTRRFPCS